MAAIIWPVWGSSDTTRLRRSGLLLFSMSCALAGGRPRGSLRTWRSIPKRHRDQLLDPRSLLLRPACQVDYIVWNLPPSCSSIDNLEDGSVTGVGSLSPAECSSPLHFIVGVAEIVVARAHGDREGGAPMVVLWHSCWSAWSPWMPWAGESSLLFAISSRIVGSGVVPRSPVPRRTASQPPSQPWTSSGVASGRAGGRRLRSDKRSATSWHPGRQAELPW